MNDRLKIASEQLAALLLAAADHGVTDCPTGMTQAEFLVGAALSYADALIAAAGEQDDWEAKFKELRTDYNDAVAANYEWESKCADLERENAALGRRAEPLTVDEARTAFQESSVVRRLETLTGVIAAHSACDRIRSRRSSDG